MTRTMRCCCASVNTWVKASSKLANTGAAVSLATSVPSSRKSAMTERNEVLFRRRFASGEEYRWLAFHKLGNKRGLPYAPPPIYDGHLECVASVEPLQRCQLLLSSYEHSVPFLILYSYDYNKRNYTNQVQEQHPLLCCSARLERLGAKMQRISEEEIALGI